MPRLLLFCLVSSQLAMTAVMGRPFPLFYGGGGGAAASIADAPTSSSSSDGGGGGGHLLHVYSLLESSFAESPMSSHHRNHSPFDRKFAGGKVILGGLAAAIFAAVFCYIRITRRKKIEPKSWLFYRITPQKRKKTNSSLIFFLFLQWGDMNKRM